MRTDELIIDLSTNLEPIRRGAAERFLAVCLVLGMGIAAAMMVMWLGLRPDLQAALDGPSFWMKAGYTLVLALVGFLLVERAGRPGARLYPTALLPLLALAIIGAVGAAQMLHAPAADRAKLLLGDSFRVCPRNILLLSLPILAGVMLAMRRMAPTRPVLAGAAAGLLAGAAGATVYGLHCPETSGMFVTVWYTLGIALVGVVGAFSGRALLRW